MVWLLTSDCCSSDSTTGGKRQPFIFLFSLNSFCRQHAPLNFVCECNLCAGSRRIRMEKTMRCDGVGEFVSLRLLLINEREEFCGLVFGTRLCRRPSIRCDAHTHTQYYNIYSHRKFKFHFRESFSAVWPCGLCWTRCTSGWEVYIQQ